MQIQIQTQSIQSTEHPPVTSSTSQMNDSHAQQPSTLDPAATIKSTLAQRRGSTELILGLSNVVATTTATTTTSQSKGSSHTFRIWEDQGKVMAITSNNSGAGTSGSGSAGVIEVGHQRE